MYARIDGRDLPVIAASATETLDASSSFNISIPITGVDWRNLQLEDCDLYYNGELYLSGYIDAEPQLQRIDDTQPLEVKLECFGEMGRLMQYRAKANAHYQNQPLTSIINDLLLMTGGTWAVTNISTMIDPGALTTIDLRSKESLFAQIIEAVKSVPQVHIRYAGMSSSIHELHMGNFNTENYLIVQGDNLISLKRQRNSGRAYRVCESYGERSGSRPVTLQHALANPATLAHPLYAQFPITLDPVTGTYICTNTAITKGNSATKQFGAIKTRNDRPPTVSEAQEAGYALWLKTVRFLQSQTFYETYDTTATFDSPPLVGDRARVIASVQEFVINPITDEGEWETTFSVNDTFRITKVTNNFEQSEVEDARGDVYVLELTSNDEAEQFDSEIELYQLLEAHDKADIIDAALGFSVMAATPVTHGPAVAADCDYPGGGAVDGKSFTIVAPTPPDWATNVSVVYTVTGTPSGAFFGAHVVSYPVTPGDPLILCIQNTVGGGWGPTLTATVNATFTYS